MRSYPGTNTTGTRYRESCRGSRDGFVENIIINTALTRRRIRDERFRFEMMRVGERGKTDIAIGYIEDVANQDLIEIIRKELQEY